MIFSAGVGDVLIKFRTMQEVKSRPPVTITVAVKIFFAFNFTGQVIEKKDVTM